MKHFWYNIRRLLFLVILCVPGVSLSHSQFVSLTGHIVDAATEQPVAYAIVLLLETGQSKNTDDDGCFQFERLSPGHYTLSVRHIAYADIERSIILPDHHMDSIVIHMHPTLLQSAEVIVRSTRTSSAITNTPYPFNVEMKDRLIQSPNVTISDALNKVPGLALVRDGIWETTISMRGMSRSNIVALIDNTRIETATDIAGALSLMNINDLERVEALKSSGSVLYGTGALGGVLHLVSKRPFFSDQFQMKAELTNSASSVNGGLSHYAAVDGSSDRYAIRVSGGYRKADNTMTPNGVLPNSQYHDYNLSGSLRLRTFGDQSLFFNYQRSQAEDTGIPGGSSLFSQMAAVRYTLARRELLGLEYEVPNLSPKILLLSLRVSRQEIERNVESNLSDTLILTPHAVHTTTNVQIESKIHPLKDHLLVVGVEAWERELDSRRERFFRNRNLIIGERPIPPSKYFSGGIYAQDEWNIIPNGMIITLGARYDWFRISNDKTLNPEYTITSGILQTAPSNQQILWNSGSTHDKSWSTNVGVQYALHPHVDISFLAATAFRSPSLEERYQFIDLGNSVRVGDPNLQSERSVYLNFGFAVHTEKVNIRADVFLNQLNNLITEVPGVFESRPAWIKKNIGKARLYGFEISGEKSFSPRTALKTSLSYVRGEDTYNHTNLPQIAPLNGQVELSSYILSLGTMSVSCSGALTQEDIAAGEIRTPGYAVLDIAFVSIPWNIGHFSFTLRSGIQNLFNKAYRNHLSTLRGVMICEPGRNYFLSATITL
jgi:hemoglobin/transferrin/lactoferrin receptor protein